MRGASGRLATDLLPFGIVSEPCLKFQALAADYHILSDLGFQTIHLVIRPQLLEEAASFHSQLRYRCATREY